MEQCYTISDNSECTMMSCVCVTVQFISIRLFPSDTSTLPAISKCTWWIPSATKVLGLLGERA